MRGYRTTKLVALAAAALVLETTVLDVLSLRGARVEALLLTACFAALFAQDSRQGLLSAWIAGLFKDAASAGPAGLHALLFLGASWGVLRVRRVLFRESTLVQGAVVFLAALAVQVLSGGFTWATAGPLPPGVIAVRSALSALLTAACAPPAFAALGRLKERTT